MSNQSPVTGSPFNVQQPFNDPSHQCESQAGFYQYAKVHNTASEMRNMKKVPLPQNTFRTAAPVTSIEQPIP
jgi:hypothetical protein